MNKRTPLILPALFTLLTGCLTGVKEIGEPVDDVDEAEETAPTASNTPQTDPTDSQSGDEPTHDTATDTGTTDGGETPSGIYCEGTDPALANCDPLRDFDPWIAGTGEVHYWIRDMKTEVFPFTTDDHPDVWYGYFQVTSPEVKREPTEDVFHAWFSETPNGPPISEDCDWYTDQATGNYFWAFKDDPTLEGACQLGELGRTLYANFETRCYPGPGGYDGTCDDNNKHKSDRTYQFDVSRRFKLY